MPQIAQIIETYASQIFWLLIVFGLIYFGIGKAMLPKVAGTVEARDRKIADDLAEAERARARADEIETAYNARITEARAAAQKAAQDGAPNEAPNGNEAPDEAQDRAQDQAQDRVERGHGHGRVGSRRRRRRLSLPTRHTPPWRAGPT